MQAVKPVWRGRLRAGYFRATTLLLGSVFFLATAAPRTEAQTRDELQKCLSAFDGIIWTLPYSPRLTAGNCKSDVHHSHIEFFTHNVLARDEQGMDSDARFTAERNAMLAHFDDLFLRQGYRHLSTELSDNPDTPYVQRARFVRSSAAGDYVLTYESALANTIRITLEKPTASGAGAKP